LAKFKGKGFLKKFGPGEITKKTGKLTSLGDGFTKGEKAPKKKAVKKKGVNKKKGAPHAEF